MASKSDINEVFEDEEKKNCFRVVVFGTARSKPGEKAYDDVFELGKKIADAGFDIVTGGGPGAMEAANMGHDASENEKTVDSYGINIKLPFEQSVNPGVEIAHEHERFSTRLDEFMSMANVVVITQGGIGTLLELFYTWQLIQIKHMNHIPIIVVGQMWEGLFEWMKKDMLSRGTFNEEDLDTIHMVDNVDAAMEAIIGWHDAWEELGSSTLKYELKGHPYKVLFDHNAGDGHYHG
ncbi:MAG: LOG family protein [Candidatus Peregrinibacteria bacterium]|nr:LOG family protein [Candidatus Peregrinibacteria bacterium]MDZ4244955.1 LOG family protein [Candidatus Gracilibacteria bacterium]